MDAKDFRRSSLVAGAPDVFLPVAGGWGRMGCTHVRLAEAGEDQVFTALRLAWQLRVEKPRPKRNKP